MKNDTEGDEMMKCQLRIRFEILMDQKIDWAALQSTNPSGIDTRYLLSSVFFNSFWNFFFLLSSLCRFVVSIHRQLFYQILNISTPTNQTEKDSQPQVLSIRVVDR